MNIRQGLNLAALLHLTGSSLFILNAILLAAPSSELKPTSSRWEAEIRAFEAKDSQHPVAPGGTLFIGSSSIRGWKTLADDFPGHRIINRGFGGSQIVDSTYFADRIVIPYAPKKIFLYAGDNDISKGKDAPTILNDFKQFVATVHQTLPKTKIDFIAIKPSLKRWHLAGEMKKANALVSTFTRGDDRLGFIDIWPPLINQAGKPRPEFFVEDGLHLNRAGYQAWTELIRPRL